MTDPKNRLIQAMRTLCERKDVEKISVNELVELAGVSRQTFYKYFRDKYELALAVYTSDVFFRADAEYRHSRDYQKTMGVILRAVKENPRLYQSLFRNADSQHSFLSQWHDFAVERDCNAIGRANVTPDVHIIVDAWVTATDKVFSDWILGGMKEREDYVLDVFVRLMPVELRAYLL